MPYLSRQEISPESLAGKTNRAQKPTVEWATVSLAIGAELVVLFLFLVLAP